MRPQTRELASDVQQSLLALSDDCLEETITAWLLFVLGQDEYIDMDEEVYKSLGCAVRSPATGQEYTSLSELDHAEPTVGEEVLWVFPDAQMLRERLSTMPLKQFSHQVIGLAGEVFREKSWAAYWGEPPSEQGSGISFMTSLSHYLQSKKGAETLSTELFEAWYQELLGNVEQTELLDDDDNDAEIAYVDVPHGRQWHFRVEFTPPSEPRSRLLAERVHSYDGTITLDETGSVMEGFLEYAPWRKEELKALSRMRRLLNRWQREEVIRWSEWKVKPPKRRSSSRNKKGARRRSRVKRE